MKFLLAVAFSFASLLLFGQSCAGKWVTVDDKTGKKKSVVQLYKKNGKLYGKIIYLFPDDRLEPNAKCTECTDDRKNKPLLGLQIVRGLKWDGSEWEKGTIVDPENGKVYKVTMWLNPINKDVLMVRGYIGIFYRTQSWHRIKDKN